MEYDQYLGWVMPGVHTWMIDFDEEAGHIRAYRWMVDDTLHGWWEEP